jgi:DNA recombination protein RmuC
MSELEMALIALLAAAPLVAAAWFLHRPRASPEQARLVGAVDALAAASHAQQRDVTALVEAARAQQQSTLALQESFAAHREQVAEVKASLAAAAQGLTEVKQGQGEKHIAIAEQLQQARQVLERLSAEAQERGVREQVAFDSMARLEAIIAGTKSRGTAGENMLAEVIKQLPPEFRSYGVRIGGGQVEFAIPLPNGRYLPVDSKWTSVEKLDQLARCAPEEREGIIASVQKDIEKKVNEVAKYLDPEKTCMMAVLAVPDAVYDLCAEAHVTAHKRGVVIVAYSMAVPYVLSVLQVIRRFGARVDEAQLSHAVRGVLGALDEMSDELEGRFAKSITQLENSRRSLKAGVGKAQQALGRVQVTETESRAEAEPQLPTPVTA